MVFGAMESSCPRRLRGTYIVLRASKKETMKRAVERSKLDRKTNIELVETMWEQFSGLGIYESNVKTQLHSQLKIRFPQ